MAFNIGQADVVEVRLFAKLLGQSVLNVWHYAGKPYQWTTPPATSTDLLAILNAQLVAQLAPNVSAQYVASHLMCALVAGYHVNRDLPGSPPPLSVYYTDVDELLTPAIVGALAGAPLPSYVAASCQKRTSIAGRKWRGASRIAGLVENDTDVGPLGNLLTAGALATFVTLWGNLAGTPFDTRPFPNPVDCRMIMGVLSLKNMWQLNPPPAGTGPVDVTVAQPNQSWRPNTTTPVNTYVGSQVSRKLGQGV